MHDCTTSFLKSWHLTTCFVFITVMSRFDNPLTTGPSFPTSFHIPGIIQVVHYNCFYFIFCGISGFCILSNSPCKWKQLCQLKHSTNRCLGHNCCQGTVVVCDFLSEIPEVRKLCTCKDCKRELQPGSNIPLNCYS